MDRDVYLPRYRALRCASSFLGSLLLACAASAAPNVLNLGSHADAFIAPAINAVLGPGVVDSSIYVDYDTNGLLADLQQPSTSTRSVATDVQAATSPTASRIPRSVARQVSSTTRFTIKLYITRTQFFRVQLHSAYAQRRPPALLLRPITQPSRPPIQPMAARTGASNSA